MFTNKRNTILILAVLLIFSLQFFLPVSAYWQEQPVTEPLPEEGVIPVIDPEQTNQEGVTDPAAIVSEIAAEPEIPLVPEITTPVYEGISEAEVAILLLIYQQMNSIGQSTSGWFAEGNLQPCTWDGISCENGMISKLEFRDKDYFCAIPEAIAALPGLKELTMENLGIRGVIPTNLFAMNTLTKLTLNGNLLGGTLPEFPSGLPLDTLIISDNLPNDMKNQQYPLRSHYAECEVYAQSQVAQGIDITPGLSGAIPQSISNLQALQTLNLSKNRFNSRVPDSLMMLGLLSTIDLSENATMETAMLMSSTLAAWVHSRPTNNTAGVMEEAPTAEPIIEPSETPLPTETPAPTSTVPVIPTETPVPTSTVPVIPTETPIPTSTVPVIPTNPIIPVIPSNTPQSIYWITVTPQPVWYTSTPAVYWVTATPNPYWVTATPYNYWPTATAISQAPWWQQATSVPQVYYPTSTVYIPQVNATPTADPAAQLGFNYASEELSADSIPMTWKYTGMKEFMINYLDQDQNLYPGFAMEWTPAAEVCNASSCNAVVSEIPQALLNGSQFYIQLQAKDSVGNVYQSVPVGMQVQSTQADAGSEAENVRQLSFMEKIIEFFLRLFGAGGNNG